jgi:hypothetical protein
MKMDGFNCKEWIRLSSSFFNKVATFTVRSRLAKFFLAQHTKTGKIYSVTTNGRKIFLMALKHSNIFHSKNLSNILNLGFLVFFKIASGRPDSKESGREEEKTDCLKKRQTLKLLTSTKSGHKILNRFWFDVQTHFRN